MTWSIESIALKGGQKKTARKRLMTGNRFIKGPVCLKWAGKAACLPGKSLHVGLALWYLRGLKKSSTVVLTSTAQEIFGVKRHAAYRALIQLERAGLVTVVRANGKAPRVTLCPADSIEIQEP